MNRRAFLLVAGLLASAPLAPARAASELTVVYVGGRDCPPCTRWKNTQRPRWLASPEFHKVTWVEVEAPRLKEAYQERYWPEELRPVIAQLPRRSGVPRFLIVRNGEILSNELGSNRWAAILTDLRKLLGD